MTFSCDSLDYFIFPLEHRKKWENEVCANLCFFGFHGSEKKSTLEIKNKVGFFKKCLSVIFFVANEKLK